MYASLFEGIHFIEGRPAQFRALAPISVQIGGAFQHAQLKSLDDVKRVMAQQARSAGGNAIIDFQYGQESVGFWRSLIHLDDVRWYGRGQIALVPAGP